jgi:hypothetical protein
LTQFPSQKCSTYCGAKQVWRSTTVCIVHLSPISWTTAQLVKWYIAQSGRCVDK